MPKEALGIMWYQWSHIWGTGKRNYQIPCSQSVVCETSARFGSFTGIGILGPHSGFSQNLGIRAQKTVKFHTQFWCTSLRPCAPSAELWQVGQIKRRQERPVTGWVPRAGVVSSQTPDVLTEWEELWGGAPVEQNTAETRNNSSLFTWSAGQQKLLPLSRMQAPRGKPLGVYFTITTSVPRTEVQIMDHIWLRAFFCKTTFYWNTITLIQSMILSNCNSQVESCDWTIWW